MMSRATLLATLCVLGGCVQAAPPVVFTSAPAEDALYQPQGLYPGRLEYAPDRSTFAPVLTRRDFYPTQDQAQAAWLRAANGHAITDVPRTAVLARPDGAPVATRMAYGGTPPELLPAAVRLFACGPGQIDNQTGRTTNSGRQHAVVCAVDFIDGSDRVMFRSPINFVYWQRAWRMDLTNPPVQLARWFAQTHSPKDPLSWVPGRARYE